MQAIVGVSDHGGWAVLVAVGPDGGLIDRRRVELIEPGLPALPHHSEGPRLPANEAVALVGRVQASAERRAAAALAELAADLPMPIAGIALRVCPVLPPTVIERIASPWANNRADWVMYRTALAEAATARGWRVHWYDAKQVLTPALAERLAAVGRAAGQPWQQDHRLAMAAAIAALG